MSGCSDGSSEVSGKTSPQQRHPAHPAMSPEPSRSLTSDLWWEQTSASAGECHPAMGLLLYACSQGCKADRDGEHAARVRCVWVGLGLRCPASPCERLHCFHCLGTVLSETRRQQDEVSSAFTLV